MTVGTTRIVGKAGPLIDLVHFLATDLSELPAPLKIAAQNWTYGTGANQVNAIYADQTTLADGANTTLDLYASGSLVDVFNQTLTMAAIKLLYVKNNSADATLYIGGGASVDLLIFKATSDIIDIPPGGTFMWTGPTAAGVVTSTNKNLKIEHNGTGGSTMAVDVVAFGLD